MSIKLEMLRVFSVVADKGTLAGAAEVLGRTPSAISMMLSQLEDNVGAPLFEKDRKSRLTLLGLLVLEESQRAIDVFEKSTAAIGRHAISTAGIVRIAAVPSATVSLLPRVIEKFRVAHPEVRIEISDGDTVSVRRRVHKDEADIGILTAQQGGTSEGELIFSDDLGIVCTEGGSIHTAHMESGNHSDWGLLQYEPLIANPLCLLVDDQLVHDLTRASTLEARNTSAILSFIRRGLGASVLTFDAVRNQPDGVEFFVPSHPTSRRELRKIKQSKDRPNAIVEEFWSLLTGN